MRWQLAATGLAAALALTSGAGAFCRARGCDPETMKCPRQKEDGCPIFGPELFWKNPCLTIGVQQDGSVRNGIDFEAFQKAVFDAFITWESANCGGLGGSLPNIRVDVAGPVECGLDSEHANVVLFRDDEWPYVGGEDELGHALVTYDVETGEILDADIEINGTEPITLSAADGKHLASVITHEVGHFLGLDHTTVTGATMVGRYLPLLATLEPDDIDGICSIYPPSETRRPPICEPPNDPASLCTGEVADLREVPYCSVSFGRRDTGSGGVAAMFLVACATWLLDRRRRFSTTTPRERC